MIRKIVPAVLLGLFIAISTAGAQIPDEFTNLKVLSKDISKNELMMEMKNFAVSLGARCALCHVGDPDGDLADFDFASDEKGPKQVARMMIQMRNAINGEYLKKAAHHEEAARIDCVTCHRGSSHPEKPEAVIQKVLAERMKSAE